MEKQMILNEHARTPENPIDPTAAPIKPVVIDLCCGKGGWSRAFIAEGYRAIGFDINQEFEADYPGEFHALDILVFARMVQEWCRLRQPNIVSRSAVIVASPPCEEFTRHQMPWTRKRNPPPPDLSLVRACESISRSSGRPMVLENVRKAQDWLGPARWHCGPFYLWGDVPAIMPTLKFGADHHDPNADVIRQKQTMSSSARADRAIVPFELARHIARVFKPVLTSERNGAERVPHAAATP